MESTISSKYKRRLTIIVVIILVSAFLSTLFGKLLYDTLLPTYMAIEDAIDTLEVTSDEDYERVLREKHPDLVGEEIGNKEETLEALKLMRDQSNYIIFRYGQGGVIASLYLAFSGIAIGTMILIIMIRKIMYKIWKDLKVWITIVAPTIIILLLLIIQPGVYLVFSGYLGMFAQIALLIYTIVKYIKNKKLEDKDDIIESKDNVVKETKEDNKDD